MTMVQDTMQEKRPSKDAKFVKEVLDIIAPSKAEHGIKICELIEAEKGATFDHWRAGRLMHSHFDWKTSRIAVVNNQIAQVFGVYDITMRIGTAVRPTYLQNKHPRNFQGWFWTDSKGNPIGYISGSGGPSCSMDAEFVKDLDKGIITEAIRQVMFQRYEELDPRAFCVVVKEGS